MGARQDEEGQEGQELVQVKQNFPRKPPVLEEDSLQVPFLELHGEFTEYVGRAENAVIALSSYRLHIKFKESVVNSLCSCEVSVPLLLIEGVECRDMLQLHITCKDCKVIRCQFSTTEQCQEWVKRLTSAIRPPSRLEELFSFSFHSWCEGVHSGEKEQPGETCRPGDHVIWRFRNEVERLGFDTQHAWRISEINSKYRLCSSYPELLLVPSWITDAELESVAAFRSWKRIPAVVYRHQSTGAVIARCGQPEVSWWGWRSADDEHLVQSIAKACSMDHASRSPLSNGTCGGENGHSTPLSDGGFDPSGMPSPEGENSDLQPRKLMILDARSYAAAVANRAKGGGCECPEYYPNCEVVFMGMANIHSIRKSFQSLRSLCTQMPDPANWLSALEGTRWLQHLSLLLKAALLAVNAVDRDHRPVLVHCSDGWDRTPQIVALSKLLLDPFYRTIEGFQVLVETEWLDFGHKFADRCGHGESSEDLNERCPVFLQWLDCVHQLHRQFPCSFQFNEAFLVKLVQHTYSCLFGTFLCNSAKERDERQVQERTCSVWSLLRPTNRAFQNILYSSHSETVLRPVCHVRNLMLWSAVYLPSSLPTTPSDDSCAPYPVPGASPEDVPLGRLPKTRSFDNLSSACEAEGLPPPNRRSSDPNLNDSWQEHRRSVELSVGVGPDGGGAEDQEGGADGQQEVGHVGGRPSDEVEVGGSAGEGLSEMEEPEASTASEIRGVGLLSEECAEEAELSIAVGVAEGQMENILQEATEEERAEEALQDISDGKCHLEDSLGPLSALPAAPPAEGVEALEMPVNEEQVDLGPSPNLEGLEDPRPLTSPIEMSIRTMTNGYGELSPVGRGAVEDRASPQGNSVQTLTEEGGISLKATCGLPAPPAEAEGPPPCTEVEASRGVSAGQGEQRTPNGPRRPSLSALHRPPVDLGQGRPVCNGGSPNGEPWGSQQAKANGARTPLSRQTSAASVGSPGAHPWGLHQRCLHGTPPEAVGRGRLDEDGLTLHSDAVQQRLRQMEAGHQLEVDTLKRQVQELWSRLEGHHSGNRGNGDRGNVDPSNSVKFLPDSECNGDPPCLSRCSAELFSEASWEQVEQQHTVTQWYPDNLKAQCYGCENRFWLATRKHHCRGKQPIEEAWNCGNVFCASCCDQRVSAPSRVCKACHSSMRVSALPPVDLELEKPITASSN
ncbi:myotubularin-related protein 3-like [Megalops cyprinoides]|uniref:myotubularin-related protein 3-like n=1 Tax=Megalops cyprinoides TaxID=118141 RepID=UPI0018655CF9|nr:myotubularin-related protein 3-like [Megalops cyprinoides]